MIKLILINYQIIKQLGNVGQTPQRHVLVYRRLVFDKDKEIIFDDAGYIVLLPVEEGAFESVNFERGGVRSEQCITQRQQSFLVIEVIAEDCIPIPLVIFCHFLFVAYVKISGGGTAPRYFLYPSECRAVFVSDYDVILLHIGVEVGNFALRDIRARIFDCYRASVAVYKYRFDNQIVSSFDNVSHNQITLSFVTFVTPT